MWIADRWKEYELLDASNGERLERWGKYILCRPDPQVIWKTEKRHPAWKEINAVYHRSPKGGGKWEFFSLPEEWSISYGLKGDLPKLSFRLKPFSFKHTGLFPEQAVNWDWMTDLISRRIKDQNEEVKILNLFAYTGGATLSCAAAGAHVTHVDASKGMVEWAKENAHCSKLPEKSFRYLVDDCMKFLNREIRRGKRYDAIIMDPPSYGRGPKGEIWKLEDSIQELLTLSEKLLSDSPLFFLLNMYTTGLSSGTLSYLMNIAIASKRSGNAEADEIGIPVTESSLVLPCGCSCRWTP